MFYAPTAAFEKVHHVNMATLIIFVPDHAKTVAGYRFNIKMSSCHYRYYKDRLNFIYFSKLYVHTYLFGPTKVTELSRIGYNMRLRANLLSTKLDSSTKDPAELKNI